MKQKKIVAAVIAAGSWTCAVAAPLPAGSLGSSSQTPYLVPSSPGVNFAALLTVGDAAANGYRMAGIPDGLGAYDNGDNTFTLLMNHELGPAAGAVHAHGSKGGFVSEWVVNKGNLSVVSGGDLIKTVNLWNGSSFAVGNNYAFTRLCSADLAAPAAFYDPASGLGTSARIYMNGEETAGGRAFAHIASGSSKGQSFEFFGMGNAAWENLVARPYADHKTVVLGTDDTSPNGDATNAKGRVYMYLGDKQATGTDFEKAGLANGQRYAIKVNGAALENRSPTAGFGLDSASKTSFSLVQDGTGTNFLRPEDISWDTRNPNRAYFVTTDTIDGADPKSGASRLWRLTFADVHDPSKGGTIEMLIDGLQPGQPQMMDNIAVDKDGRIVIQEDVGNNKRLGRIWQFDPDTRGLRELGQHDPNRFLAGAVGFLTEDEESSGVIDVTELFKGVSGYDVDRFRYYLLDVQAHYGVADPALVEGGQLLIMAIPVSEPGGLALMSGGLAMLGVLKVRRRN